MNDHFALQAIVHSPNREKLADPAVRELMIRDRQLVEPRSALGDRDLVRRVGPRGLRMDRRSLKVITAAVT